MPLRLLSLNTGFMELSNIACTLNSKGSEFPLLLILERLLSHLPKRYSGSRHLIVTPSFSIFGVSFYHQLGPKCKTPSSTLCHPSRVKIPPLIWPLRMLKLNFVFRQCGEFHLFLIILQPTPYRWKCEISFLLNL